MVKLFGKNIRLFRPRSIWIRRVAQWFFFLLIALKDFASANGLNFETLKPALQAEVDKVKP